MIFTLILLVTPSVSGGCDSANFFIFVKYGSPGFSFHTIVGKRALTRSLSQDYSFMENSTHLSLVVPSTAPDVAIEVRSESNGGNIHTLNMFPHFIYFYFYFFFKFCPGCEVIIHQGQTGCEPEKTWLLRSSWRIHPGLQFPIITDWFVTNYCISSFSIEGNTVTVVCCSSQSASPMVPWLHWLWNWSLFPIWTPASSLSETPAVAPTTVMTATLSLSLLGTPVVQLDGYLFVYP